MSDDRSYSSFLYGVGDRLREAEQLFTNRTAAAEAAGVSKSTFERWVNGRTDLSLDGLARFAKATGYTLEWLAFGEGPKRRAEHPGQVPGASHLDGELFEELYGETKRLAGPLWSRMDERGRFLAVIDLADRVGHFPTAIERRAALAVLVADRLEARIAAMTAHQRIPATNANAAPDPPPEPD